MNNLKIEKVVNSVPDVLTENTIYFVKIGNGFDIYVTDNVGEVAYKNNSSSGGSSYDIWDVKGELLKDSTSFNIGNNNIISGDNIIGTVSLPTNNFALSEKAIIKNCNIKFNDLKDGAFLIYFSDTIYNEFMEIASSSNQNNVVLLVNKTSSAITIQIIKLSNSLNDATSFDPSLVNSFDISVDANGQITINTFKVNSNLSFDNTPLYMGIIEIPQELMGLPPAESVSYDISGLGTTTEIPANTIVQVYICLGELITK